MKYKQCPIYKIHGNQDQRRQSKQKSKHWVFSSYQSLVLHHPQLKQATSKGPHQNKWVWLFKFHIRIEQGRLPYHYHQAKNSWLNTFTHLIVHHSRSQWSQAFPYLKERCCCRLFCGIEFNELESVCCEFVLMAEGSHWSITFVIQHGLLIYPLHLWKWAGEWGQVECVELTRRRENKWKDVSTQVGGHEPWRGRRSGRVSSSTHSPALVGLTIGDFFR